MVAFLDRCAGCSRVLLGIINGIFFLLGIATIAASSYGWSLGFMVDADSAVQPYVWALISGVMLVLMSMCGCLGSMCLKPTSTIKQTCAFKVVVVIYMCLFLVIVIGNLCGGAIILALDGELSDLQPAASAADSVNATLDKWATQYYEEPYCCGNASATAAPSPAPAVSFSFSSPPPAGSCRVLGQEVACKQGLAAFLDIVRATLKGLLLPSGVTFLVLGFLALLSTVAAGVVCRRVHDEDDARYGHLLISEFDQDADVYSRIAGVPQRKGSRRRSSAHQDEMEYQVDGLLNM